MQRRDFIHFGSLLIAGCATTPSSELFVKKTKKILMQPYEDFATRKYGIFCFDFEALKLSHVETRFSVHSIFYDELLGEYIGVNKYGPNYLKFKYFTQRDIKYFKVDENIFLFSGHTSSTPSDKNYYFTGVVPQSGKSGILAIDKKTDAVKIVAEVEAHNPPVHDCKFSKTSEELFFTGANNVYTWSPKSQELKIKKIALTTKDSSLRHFEINSNTELCLQSNIINTKNDYEYEGAEVVFQSENSSERVLVKNINLSLSSNELLDFSFDDEQKSFACVHAKSRALSVWETKPLKLKKMIEFDEWPVRVSGYFGEKQFLVMSTKGFYLVGQGDLKITKISTFREAFKKTYLFGHKLTLLLA